MEPISNQILLESKTFNDAQLSLGGLSSQARNLVENLLSDQVLMNTLLEKFVNDHEGMWQLAEHLVGPLNNSDRRLLELIAEVFLPSSSQNLIIINGCPGNGGGCWVSDPK